VPGPVLEKVIQLYHKDLDEFGLEYVMFGHIGDNHIHVNIIPDSMADYERGGELYLKWVKAVAEMGGTVSAEHGIGKLKAAFLRVMYGEEGIRQMRDVKHCFDPDNLLNPDNLFCGHEKKGSFAESVGKKIRILDRIYRIGRQDY
ncbi:FAD-linked oxidase C-terminal domain-containing protein, partial [Verrucomicrobiota bacterium]